MAGSPRPSSSSIAAASLWARTRRKRPSSATGSSPPTIPAAGYSGRGGHVELPQAARPGMGLDDVRYSGDPDTVVRQIEEFYDATGMGVIDLIFGGFTSTLTIDETAKSMRLFATEVVPRIRHLGEPVLERPSARPARVGAAQ